MIYYIVYIFKNRASDFLKNIEIESRSIEKSEKSLMQSITYTNSMMEQIFNLQAKLKNDKRFLEVNIKIFFFFSYIL